MKKLKSLFLVALLALGANLSAQETEATAGATGSGSSAAGASATAGASTIGGIATSTVVIGAVAAGVAVAIVANNDDDGVNCAADEVEQNGQCVCPNGQVKFNGTCTTQSLVCNDSRGGDLNAAGDLCVIPANTILDENGVTITNTITYTPVLFP